MANRKSYNRWWWIVAIAVILLPLGLYFGFGGLVIGEEFSPDDFTRRRFVYNVMPLFGITLLSVRYEDTTPIFDQSLKDDKLIGSARAIKQWDLITDFQYGLDMLFPSETPVPEFDAGLLCGVLDIKNANNESIWIFWNQDHPKLAKTVWPIIGDMVRAGLYIDASEIMLQGVDLQESGRDPFLATVKRSSTAAFNRLAQQKFDQSDFESATELFTKSIQIQPSRDAYLGRAQSHRKLGDSTASDRDRLAAENLAD